MAAGANVVHRLIASICSLKCLLVFAVSLTVLVHAGEEAPDAEAFIKSLGSDRFEEREHAQQRLLTLGGRARDALQRAILTESDPELLMRAKYVLGEVLCKELRDSVMKKSGKDYGAKDLEMRKVLAKNFDEAGLLDREAMYRFLTPNGVEMLIQQMRQLLRNDPQDKNVAYVLGCSLYWQENFDEAISAWLYVELLDGRFVRAIVGRGRACMRKGKYDEARKAFETAATIAPKLADPIWNLALLNAEIGDFKRALEVWRASYGLSGSCESDMTYSIGLSRLLAGTGDIAGAKNALQHAFEEIESTRAHSPYSEYYPLLVYNEFAKMYQDAGLIKEFDQNLLDAKLKVPSEKSGPHPETLLMEANSLINHGELREAAKLIKQVMQVRGETASLRKLMSKTTVPNK